MRSILNEFILEKISRKQKNLTGSVLVPPYMRMINTQETWCVDLVIDSTKEVLYHVPIAENNRQIQNFINIDTPVTLTKSTAGMMMVIGLSDKRKRDTKIKQYKINDYSLGFTQGWKKSGSGDEDYETGSGNTPSIPAESEVTYTYISRKLTFGELIFGTTPFGAYEITRVET